MPSRVVRILLFFSSYAPLFLILAVREAFASPASLLSATALALIAVLSGLALWAYLCAARRLSPDEVTIRSVTPRDAEAMSYIVTYVIPFLGIDFRDVGNAISLTIFFVVLAAIYTHSSLIFTNPLLNLAGFHLYEVQIDDGKVVALLSKRRYVGIGARVEIVPVGDFGLLEISR